MRTRLWGGLTATALVFPLAALAQDNLDGPYATHHGDLHGTQRIPVTALDWSNGAQLAWEFETGAAGLGLDRVVGRGPITFDSDGNLYWITSVGGDTGGFQKVASIDPGGNLRWSSAPINDSSGSPFTATGAVVGVDAVYACGGDTPSDYDGDGVAGQLTVAVNKSDGTFLWETDLDGDWNNDGSAEDNLAGLDPFGPLTPILKDGVLYITLVGDAGLQLVQLDAATGALLAYDVIEPIISRTQQGQQIYVDDVFGAGLDGLFLNYYDGLNDWSAGTGLNDVIAIQVDPGIAGTLAWSAPGGFHARTSLTYNPANNHVYAHTWNNQSVTDPFDVDRTSFASYDAFSGALTDHENPGYGHGFYDLAALSVDGTRMFVGGFNGRIAAYQLNADGTLGATPDYGDPVEAYFGEDWWGEPRTYGNLAYTSDGTPLVFTGTNSRVNDLGPEFTARIVVLDMSQAQLAPDDSPIWIDDIEILEGASVAGATVTYSEDFEDDGPGVAVSALADPAGGSWGDESNNEPEPTTVTNPFQDANNGSSTVLELDSLGNGTWQAGRWNLAGEVGVPFDLASANDPQRFVVIRWKQYRGDVTDNFFYEYAPQNFGVQWDVSRNASAVGFDGDAFAEVESDKWQTVELQLDFFDDAADILVDGAFGGASIPAFFVQDTEAGITSLYFDLTGTETSENTTPPVAEFDSGQAADNGFTLRGGPVMGPDGKVYVFKQDGELLAIEPVPGATLIGDSNCDGVIDFFDIDPFVTALVSGPADWESQFDCDFVIANDINADGTVDFFDIDPFVALLVGG